MWHITQRHTENNNNNNNTQNYYWIIGIFMSVYLCDLCEKVTREYKIWSICLLVCLLQWRQLSGTAVIEIKITVICSKTNCTQVFDRLAVFEFQQWSRLIGIGEDTQFAGLCQFNNHFDWLELIQDVIFMDLGHNFAILPDQMLWIAPSADNWKKDFFFMFNENPFEGRTVSAQFESQTYRFRSHLLDSGCCRWSAKCVHHEHPSRRMAIEHWIHLVWYF